ncbi:hypothetical protein [Gymnodinialimonas ulvae]|uniref:hypothetical protein n=1 Tax=Gymnodinialimonas ulvae TaxID=3126504 RepID=UPI0030EB6B76
MKGPALFAHALEEAMNELGADGWQYLRADTLPQEERAGLTSKTTTYRNLLVFQREIAPEPSEEAAVPVSEPASIDPPTDEVENFWEDPEKIEESGLERVLFPDRQR